MQTVRVLKLKNAVGFCYLCKNSARWRIEVIKHGLIASRIPVCDKHRPRPGDEKKLMEAKNA